MLRYAFAGNVPEISDLVASLLLVSIALLFMFGFAVWLVIACRAFEQNDI